MFNKLLFVTCILLMQGCSAFWPYKSDFDCDIKRHEKCQSLYAVNIQADKGIYTPNSNGS